MALEKIGDIGVGGAGLSTGNEGDGSSLKALLGAVRDELDAHYAKVRGELNALYAKLSADAGVTDTNYATLATTFTSDVKFSK